MMTQESLNAFVSVEPILPTFDARVTTYIRDNPGCTNDDLTRGLGMPIQSVTPSTFRLKQQGLVWIVGHKPTSTGRSAGAMSLARCPTCGRTELDIRKEQQGVFRYECGAHHVFRAYVGARCSEEAVIVREGEA